MVDFNNETTIGRPAFDVEKICILQRRYDFVDAFEDYKKKKFRNINVDLSTIRARLITLFLQLQATLLRRWGDKENSQYFKIKKVVLDSKSKEEDIMEVFFTLSQELDKMHITKIDTSKVYDSRRTEGENKEKGY